MGALLRQWAQLIAGSAPHDWALYLLRNIPGFPPIMQTIHIVSIAAVVASILFIHLRVLGLAYPSQQPQSMLNRLMPWTWWALPVLFISGLPLILARPMRYFTNPVFGVKVAAIVIVIAITLVFVRLMRAAGSNGPFSYKLKVLSIVSLGLWIFIMLAGRWIAYAEYLRPLE